MQEINIIPRKYNIEIKPDINNHNFDGLICINFDTKKEINKIPTKKKEKTKLKKKEIVTKPAKTKEKKTKKVKKKDK